MLKSMTNLRARRAAGFAIVLLGLVFLFPQVALAQCAMCRRALQSPEGQQMIAALRSGIVFLLIAPFAVFATIAVLAVRAERRHGPTRRARLPEFRQQGDISIAGLIFLAVATLLEYISKKGM